MRTTFKRYLRLTEDLMDIFRGLKKKLKLVLSEEIEVERPEDYFVPLAMFEQYFRFLKSHAIDPVDVPGLNAFISLNDLTKVDQAAFKRHIDSVLQQVARERFIDFDRVTEFRATEFGKWYGKKAKDGIKIIIDAVDFVVKAMEQYQRAHV